MLVNRKAYSTVCYKSIYTHVTYTLAYAWRKQRRKRLPVCSHCALVTFAGLP